MTEYIKNLIKIPSVSGREEKLAKYIQTVITPYVDESYIDALGNLIALKKGVGEGRKKVMLAAHMDEIGFFVNFIEENGFIRIAPIGGINFISAAFTTVTFENGTVGVLVPEGQTKAEDYRSDKFYIDIGCASRKEAEKKVKIGDSVIVTPSLTRLLNHRYAGRALDDKIGCAAMMEICRRMAEADCPNDVYYAFTVQEEVGCRGSKTAAYAIRPDFAIAYDVTGTGDSQNARRMAVKLGGGAAIKLKDASVICDIPFAKLMEKVAAEHKIAHQTEILEAGGTDTSSMQMAAEGSIAGALSIPTRYIHSSVETFDMRDVEACVALTCRVLALDLGKEYAAK